MGNRIIIYSCISGGYDKIINDGRLYVPPPDINATHRVKAKVAKILPHKFLPNHDWSIWIDANMKLKLTEEEFLKHFEYPDIGVFNHPWRKSIAQEINACKKAKLDSIKNLEYHMGKGGTLAMCGFIIRKNIPKVHKLNEEWWAEIKAGSSRDQISFSLYSRSFCNI